MKPLVRRVLKVSAYGLAALIALIGFVVVAVLITAPPVPRLPDVPPEPPALSNRQGAFELDVSPRHALIDVPIRIVVRGLESGEEVVLRASTEDAAGLRFSSWARFRADHDGELDLSKSAPLDGTYRSRDSCGLLWSMRSPSGEIFESSPSWTTRLYRIRAETRSGTVAAEITRSYPWDAVTLEEVQVGDVRAELWLPESEQPLPVIVRLGGSGGGPSRHRSALLAVRGFAVLDLLYHSDGEALPELVGIPIERVVGAVDWALADPRLDGRRVGLYGTSKGAELALAVAVREPRIRAVAAWAPTSAAFEGISFRRAKPGSSWSWEGKPVPYAPYQLDLQALSNPLRLILGRPMHFRPVYQRALDNAPDDAFLALERSSARLLLLAGGDDQMAPSALMAEQIVRRLERAGRESLVKSIIYEDAGHAMLYDLWPYGGQPERRVLHGGTEETNHLAGREAWAEIIALFETEL